MTEILTEALKRVGRQTPTLTNVDETCQSLADGPNVRRWLEQWGIHLLDWQWYVLRNSLAIKTEKDEDGNLLFINRNIGLSVPRQNGKTEILVARAFLGITLIKENIVYSSYRSESANMIFNRMRDIILNGPENLRKAYFPHIPTAKIRDKALEAHHPQTGELLGKVRFITRMGGAGRGASESVIFYDEAQDLTEAQEASMSAGIATFKNGQIWFVGTPEPSEASATLGNSSKGISTIFSERRKDFKKNNLGSIWMEWGVQELKEKDDVDAWYESNPSLGISMGKGRGLFEDDLRASSLNELDFNIERLGFWSVQKKESAIDITRWKNLRIDREEVMKLVGKPLVLAIKSDFGGDKVHLAIAIKDKDRIYVERIATYDQDEQWVSKLVEEHLKKYLKNDICKTIIIDGDTARAQLKPALQQLGRWSASGNQTKQGTVRFATTQDVQTATSYMISSITEKTISHIDQEALTDAVQDATVRTNKDGTKQYGFSSISGKINMTALETASLAVYAASIINNNDLGESGQKTFTLNNGEQMVVKKVFPNQVTRTSVFD